ncbi:MAG: hypothetical protein ACSLE0_13865 [Chitinophagaceae bacterium]
MTFSKNIAFTAHIKINGRIREYNFRKRSPVLYDTDTSDERGNRFTFSMIKEEDLWKIKDSKLPDWLIKSESLIHAAIVKEEGE